MKEIDSILSEFIANDCPGSMNYQEYLELIERVHAEDKTTGSNQSENYVHYSKLNEHRMKRLNKTVKLNPELIAKVESIKENQLWIVITEAWCGDAAQNLPIISKMADLNENISLRLILRDDNPEIMNLYLTNGGKSIPKLIAIDDSMQEVFNWGPRPAPMQEMVIKYHDTPEPKPDYSEFVLDVQKWYNADKTQTFQKELESIL